MMPSPVFSISEVTALYEWAAAPALVEVPVEHTGLRELGRSLARFYRSLGESASDEFWRPLRHFCGSYLRTALVAPFPLNHSGLYDEAAIRPLRRQLRLAGEVFPDHAQGASLLLDQLQELARRDENPLLGALADLQQDLSESVTLVVPWPQLASAVEAFLRGIPEWDKVQVITPSMLRGACYEHLVLLGGVGRYRPWIIQTPRAPNVYALGYRWGMGRVDDSPVFAAPVTGASPIQIYHQSVVLPVETQMQDGTDEDIVVELFPVVSLQEFAQRISSGQEARGHQRVEAMLFEVDGRQGVPLDQSTRELVITIPDEGEPTVERVDVPSIEEGMFLLFRDGSGGDSIAELADTLLGSEAEGLRDDQAEWKRRLQVQVDDRGLQQVGLELERRGSRRSNTTNLRNWLSPSFMCPQDYPDLAAIIEQVGLSDPQRWWDRMQTLQSAHRQAGQVIGKLLREQVRQADLGRLVHAGRLQFHLAEYGHSLTAYRVDQVHAAPLQVPPGKLRRLTPMEEDTWLE